MSNRKQSSQTKPLYVKDRIDLAHRMQTSEGKPWGEFLDQAPVIHGGPMVTEMSLNLLGSMRVQHWETWKHATERGVTVDRALGVEVMSAKQPADALWGFTVYPMAPIAKPAPKPASAKPKAIVKRSKPMASPKPLPPIKRKAKLGKMFSYQAEYEAALARSRAGKVLPVTGQSSRETWLANRVPCSAKAFGFTYTQLAKSWNDYVRANPKCGLKDTSAQKLTECGQASLAY